jgi:hypothetical protein
MMKKVVLTFFALIAFTAFTFAQDTQVKKTKPTEGPILTLESDVIDYGSIERNSEPLRTVSFTNTGTEPLIIKSARGNCGCTVPKWPKEPILPGETKQLEVRYATNRVGKFSKKVTLRTNEGDSVLHTIKVMGEVMKPESDEGVPQKKPNMLNGN